MTTNTNTGKEKIYQELFDARVSLDEKKIEQANKEWTGIDWYGKSILEEEKKCLDQLPDTQEKIERLKIVEYLILDDQERERTEYPISVIEIENGQFTRYCFNQGIKMGEPIRDMLDYWIDNTEEGLLDGDEDKYDLLCAFLQENKGHKCSVSSNILHNPIIFRRK